MAAGTLGLEFDKGTRRYQPGELITGSVDVDVDAPTRCQALTLAWNWHTHGRGNPASGEPHSTTLFVGEWTPGRHRYRFEFVCPTLPATHHGPLLNLAWTVEARADVPWALDPKTDLDFTIELPPTAQPLVRSDTRARKGEFVRDLGGAVFLIPALVIAGWIILDTIASRGSLVIAGIGLGFCGFFAWMGWALLRKTVGRKALRRLATKVTSVDDKLLVDLDFASPRSINMVRVSIVGEEVVVQGYGTRQTTHRQRIHQRDHVVYPGHAGDHHMQASLAMPEFIELGWSFSTNANTLAWFVEYEIDIEGWPDLVDTIPLQVSPLL